MLSLLVAVVVAFRPVVMYKCIRMRMKAYNRKAMLNYQTVIRIGSLNKKEVVTTDLYMISIYVT